MYYHAIPQYAIDITYGNGLKVDFLHDIAHVLKDELEHTQHS